MYYNLPKMLTQHVRLLQSTRVNIVLISFHICLIEMVYMRQNQSFLLRQLTTRFANQIPVTMEEHVLLTEIRR